jgi:hypothetical protein
LCWSAISWASKQTVGSSSVKFVLIKLADNANDEGYCWPSFNHISKHTELSRSTVIRAIKNLATKGFIQVKPRHKDKDGAIITLSNGYQLLMGEPGAPVTLGESGDDTPPVSPGHPNHQKNPHPNLKKHQSPSGVAAKAANSEKRKPLDPRIKQWSDQIYESNPRKYNQLITWIDAAGRTYHPQVIATALRLFHRKMGNVKGSWWGYIDKILDAEEVRFNARNAELESERVKAEERSFLAKVLH